MTHDRKQEVTQLLNQFKDGDSQSNTELMALIYRELRSFAGNILKQENQTITFQATELVNEAYFRLFDSSAADWNDRKHFLSSAIVVMRRLLVDHARKKHAQRRIPKNQQTPFEAVSAITESLDLDVVALNDALDDLEKLDSRGAKIVELRFFGGLSEDEIAQFMGLSRSTVNREWQACKLWLLHQLCDHDA
ncbi:ECF-type sigma factor [Marinicella meishanensis]|uniref:ECF-type sigma factor n=1 Tax=Marinicella meishanensis TaxID=2873263 RepID=UPI001CBB4AAE|nr:ECF-type sigma factor [Marinicella sp. NBU2979]